MLYGQNSDLPQTPVHRILANKANIGASGAGLNVYMATRRCIVIGSVNGNITATNFQGRFDIYIYKSAASLDMSVTYGQAKFPNGAYPGTTIPFFIQLEVGEAVTAYYWTDSTSILTLYCDYVVIPNS